MINADQTTTVLLDAIEREKAKIRESMPELERRRDETFKDLDVAGIAQNKAWDLVVKSSEGKKGSGRLDDVPPEVLKAAYEADKTYRTADIAFTGYDVKLRRAVARLAELETPEALEKLREKRSGLHRLRESKPSKANARDMGFPDVYLTESGNFIPGYDSKAKSDLRHFLNHQPKPDALHKFKSTDLAWRLVEARGWEKYMLPAKKPAATKAA